MATIKKADTISTSGSREPRFNPKFTTSPANGPQASKGPTPKIDTDRFRRLSGLPGRFFRT